jgi:hypothetical protein
MSASPSPRHWPRRALSRVSTVSLWQRYEIQQPLLPQLLKNDTIVPIALTGELFQAGIGEITVSKVHLDGLATVFEQADPEDKQRYRRYWQISQHLMLM